MTPPKLLTESHNPFVINEINNGHYHLTVENNKKYLAFGDKVVCVANGKVSEQDKNNNSIIQAQAFFRSLPAETKTLAEKTAKVATGKPMARSSVLPQPLKQEEASSSLEPLAAPTPDKKVLSDMQCEWLKILFDSGEAFFDPDSESISGPFGIPHYMPNDNDTFIQCSNHAKLTNYKAVVQRYDSWLSTKENPPRENDEVPRVPNQKLSGSPLAANSPQLTNKPEFLPEPARMKNVESIKTLIQFVSRGHRPLVIFDVDETLIARKFKQQQKSLIEPDAESTIMQIKQKAPDAHIILLSQAAREHTLNKLSFTTLDTRIFDNIESSQNEMGSKGESIKRYIAENNLSPGQVCFIDDTDSMLDSVEETCRELNIPCNTFLFTGADDLVAQELADALQIPVEKFKETYS